MQYIQIFQSMQKGSSFFYITSKYLSKTEPRLLDPSSINNLSEKKNPETGMKINQNTFSSNLNKPQSYSHLINTKKYIDSDITEEILAQNLIKNPIISDVLYFVQRSKEYECRLSKQAEVDITNNNSEQNFLHLQRLAQNLFYLYLSVNNPQISRQHVLMYLKTFNINLLFTNQIALEDLFLISASLFYNFQTANEKIFKNSEFLLKTIIQSYDIALAENIIDNDLSFFSTVKKQSPDYTIKKYFDAYISFFLAVFKLTSGIHQFFDIMLKKENFVDFFNKVMLLGVEVLQIQDNKYHLTFKYLEAIDFYDRFLFMGTRSTYNYGIVQVYRNLVQLNNFDEFSVTRITFLSYFNSKYDMWTVNFRLFQQILFLTKNYLLKNWEKFSQKQLITIFYSYGKVGYCDEDLTKKVKNEISTLNSLTTKIIQPTDLLKFWLFSTNTNLVDSTNFMNFEKRFLEFFNQSTNILEKSLFIIKVISQVVRLQIWDTKLWDIFFVSIPYAKEKTDKYKVFFVMKILEIFFDEINNLNLKAKAQQFLSENQDIMNKNTFEFFDEQNPFVRKLSSLEMLIQDFLLLAGIKFQKEHSIPPFIVDFYIPEYNLVIEAMGPHHFINFGNELNLISKFKKDVIQKKKINYLTLSFEDEPQKIIEAKIASIVESTTFQEDNSSK